MRLYGEGRLGVAAWSNRILLLAMLLVCAVALRADDVPPASP